MVQHPAAARVVGESPADSAPLNNNPKTGTKPASGKAKIIMGWVENVTVEDIDAKMKAKLDTGATTSSLRADVLKIVKPADKGGKRRVIFQIEDSTGVKHSYDRPLVRHVAIKDKYGELQHRPVVEMSFCVAGRRVRSEVNLSSRADFLYPVLIGRNMLQQAGIIVDPSLTFTSKTRCAAPVTSAKDD